MGDGLGLSKYQSNVSEWVLFAADSSVGVSLIQFTVATANINTAGMDEEKLVILLLYNIQTETGLVINLNRSFYSNG